MTNLPMPSMQSDVSLACYTSLKIGGPARYFVEVSTVSELSEAVNWARGKSLEIFVLGGGTNVVISDEGFGGLVIKLNLKGTFFKQRDIVGVFSGENWDDFVLKTVENNLQGLECLSGIPGCAGAAPVQNIGAYGQEVCDTIVEVETFDVESASLRVFRRDLCGFTYRNSIFKNNSRYIITSVTFRLNTEGIPQIAYRDLVHLADHSPTLPELREEVIKIRKSKGMVLDPEDKNSVSVGSFFTNPIINSTEFAAIQEKVVTHAGDKSGNTREFKAAGGFHTTALAVPHWPTAGGYKVSAAWLIEQADFYKGMVAQNGKVGISEKHSLAIINKGSASSADIIGFATEIQKSVLESFGVLLKPEPVFVGFPQNPLS